LESVCAGNRTVGSNPTLSAIRSADIFELKREIFDAEDGAPKSVPRSNLTTTT
jgi:hypothetical protein